MQKANSQKSKNSNKKPEGKDKNKPKGKQQKRPDISMRDNDEYLDDELDELDEDDMDLLDDVDEESDLFWKLEVKENEENTMEVPEHFDGVVYVTQASFGENVNKGSRTIVCCKTPALDEPTPVCVLTEGTHETHPLNLKFTSPADFSLKGHQPSTVYLTGYVDVQLDTLGGLPGDEDFEVPQSFLSKMKRRYDDEEAEQLEPATKKRKIDGPKGKKAVEAKKIEDKKPETSGNKKQQQQSNKKPSEPASQPQSEPQTKETKETTETAPQIVVPQITVPQITVPQTAAPQTTPQQTTTPQVPQTPENKVNPTTPTESAKSNSGKLTKSQKRKLKKQQQQHQNGNQTEENKADNTQQQETTPKSEDKPQEPKQTQNDNVKPQTSEKTETVAPSNEAPKTNDTPTKNTNEKNGVKEGGDKAGDSKEKQQKQQPQKKPVEKKLPNGIEIKDLKVGTGPDIKHGQVIKLMYAGQLSNKTVFDKQLTGSGFEYKFGSEEGLKGWNLGMKGMKLGGKRRITIPPKFAFGADGNPAKNVPGDSTVTYTIEILEEPKQ